MMQEVDAPNVAYLPRCPDNALATLTVSELTVGVELNGGKRVGSLFIFVDDDHVTTNIVSVVAVFSCGDGCDRPWDQPLPDPTV